MILILVSKTILASVIVLEADEGPYFSESFRSLSLDS